ncbi:MAG TPA: glucose 1-dehydrogenase [Bryobacteraceae bacterium]|nr:glucose 1-dehydrogenase [Bryobacteraceae bacterium]
MKKLEGKIALITGGSSGIGLATAALFQEQGAQVIVTGRSVKAIDEARRVLGNGALALQSDASKLAEVERLAETIRNRFGRVDVLFANAGIAKFRPIGEVDEEFFDEIFNTNVKGVFFTIRCILPLIPDGGAILLNSSVAGRVAAPNISVYAATKAAVRSLGRTLAAEVAPRRIRVNTISPGPVSTPLFLKTGLSPDAAAGLEKRLAEQTALKRAGQPEEIARAALFLASEDASFMIGAEMLVDGGIAYL